MVLALHVGVFGLGAPNWNGNAYRRVLSRIGRPDGQ
jgi:hypothetical protein